ncbi:Solute carrier family 22 member 4 [Aphelenchoides bicaudatus]|nr:Solute carrier family 22 member 4 [Aphelenchoides bicaudatus]
MTDKIVDNPAHSSTKENEVEKVSLKHESQDEGYHHFEQVFDTIKQYGKYQMFTFLLAQYIMLCSAGNYIFISFAALKPQCLIREVNTITDVCQRINSCPVNDTVTVFHSLYAEDFVCPHSYLPNNLQTLQAVGSGVGALLGGHFADAFGRKWITYAGALLMCSFGFIGGLSPNFIVLAICMIGVGLSYGVLIDSLMTLAAETVGPKYRIVQTLAFQWTIAMQLAALIAWLSQHWRYYLLIVNGVCAPILLLMLFWVESPRWLIQRRRFQEACNSLNTIGNWNGAKKKFGVDDLIKMQIKVEPRSQMYSIKDLFINKKLFQYSIVMILSALTVELCVGCWLEIPFLNVALYGALRLWTPFFVIYADTQTIGRRWLFIASQTFSIVCYSIVIASNLFPVSLASNIIRSVFALFGGVVNSSIFFTVYKQYTIELYPTLMRAIAVGAFGVVERVGGAMAPQLINMNSWAWSGSALSITTLIMCLSLIAGCAILPETKDADMPDIQEEAVNRKKSGTI